MRLWDGLVMWLRDCGYNRLQVMVGDLGGGLLMRPLDV